MKFLAAAAMAPLVQLREAVPDERLMLEFCGDDGVEWNLSRPFGVGSLTYATDRAAMIRCELPNRLEVDEIKLPPVRKVWNDYWSPSRQWRPLTVEDIQPTVLSPDSCGHCPECGDRRITLSEYPDFNDPVVNARVRELGYDIDDNSIFDESCPMCRGGKYDGPNVTMIAGVPHWGFFAKRIAALPNVEVCRGQNTALTVLFRADGFEGISLGVDLCRSTE